MRQSTTIFIHTAKSVFATFLLGMAGLLASSCASGPGSAGATIVADTAAQKPASSAKRNPRMFWTVQSAQGGGTAYIQGTLHLGSDELYPLDAEVLSRLKSADLVLGELSSADIDRSSTLILERMSYALLDRSRTLTDILSKDEAAFLEEFLGKDVLRTIALFHPWVAYTYLDAIAAGKSGLSAEKGVDMALYAAAAEYGKAVGGLETLEKQLDVLTGPPLATQLLVLKDAIREYRENPRAIEELYRAYLQDDRKALARIVGESIERTERYSAELSSFNDSLLGKRNAVWADRIASLLREGQTVFVFAGAAHFTGEGNVLDLLADRGFKVKP